MEQRVKEVFESRQAITNNIDELLKYSRAFHKDKEKSCAQLSLFGEETIDIVKPELKKRALSDQDIYGLSMKEKEVLGMSITYDPFQEFILIENCLCTSTVFEMSMLTEDKANCVFIALLKEARVMMSKKGNRYYKLLWERDGVEFNAYLDWRSSDKIISECVTGKIHIIRAGYLGGRYVTSKVTVIDRIDPSKYIKSINIILNRPEAVVGVRMQLFINSDNKGVPVTVEYEGAKFPFKDNVSLNADAVNKIISNGCKVQLNRSI